MYEEMIEELVENRISLVNAIAEIRDLKLVFIGLFIGISVVIIFSIVWSCLYE